MTLSAMCTVHRFIIVLSGYISIISTTITNVESANILFLLPVPSASHRLWNNVLIEGLEERGHNLTVLTVEMERSRQNVTYICMKNIYETLDEFYNDENGNAMWNLNQKSSFAVIKESYRLGNFVSRRIFSSNGLEQLLNYPQTFKFDAIIFDYTMGQSLLAFVEYFGNPPLISVSPHSHPLRLNAASSTKIPPSYISHYSRLSTTKSLTEKITERFMNAFIYHTFDWFYARYIYMRNENHRVWKVFGMKNVKHFELEQLEYSDLVLINRNFAFDDIFPLPPNVIPIAAIQAQRTNEIPNDDVITFIEHSEKPIILFTMGSSMLAEDLGYEIMHEIMNAFRELNDFSIICKCNEKFIRKSSQPQNVLFVGWMQQNEILGNLKVRLVITHGGMLTIQEAIWHAKPIFGIPIQIDHHRNINRAIELGFAESINVHNFTALEIVIKVRMMIESPIYQMNVRKASELMKSQSPVKPKELAIFWIEQVLKHKGLKHLQSEARMMNFFQLYLIDIISIIAFIILIYILLMQYHIIKGWMLRKIDKNAENEIMNEADKLKSE